MSVKVSTLLDTPWLLMTDPRNPFEVTVCRMLVTKTEPKTSTGNKPVFMFFCMIFSPKAFIVSGSRNTSYMLSTTPKSGL